MTNYPLMSDDTGQFIEDWGFIPHPDEEDEDASYLGWERYQLNRVKVKPLNGGSHKYAPKDTKRIWTVVESGSCSCLWICAGERLVNAIHYMVSTKPWDDLTLEWCDYECMECQEKTEEEE